MSTFSVQSPLTWEKGQQKQESRQPFQEKAIQQKQGLRVENSTLSRVLKAFFNDFWGKNYTLVKKKKGLKTCKRQ